jgi:hypothetical protein
MLLGGYVSDEKSAACSLYRAVRLGMSEICLVCSLQNSVELQMPTLLNPYECLSVNSEETLLEE